MSRSRSVCTTATATQRLHRLGDVPAHLGRLVDEDAIRHAQRIRERRLVGAELHRIGARLEHGDDPAVDLSAAHPVQGVADSGGVMRKVVVNKDAVDIAAQLEPPPDAAEAGERLERNQLLDAGVACGDECRERVLGVVPPEHVPVDGAYAASALPDLDVSVACIACDELPVGRDHRIERKSFHGRPAAHLQHLGEMPVARIDHEPPVARHRPQQQVKLPLDRADVGIDVRVVVLEVVQYRGARPVVHELGALVEERRVVLVRLDHEVAARCRAARSP